MVPETSHADARIAYIEHDAVHVLVAIAQIMPARIDTEFATY